MKRSLFVFLTAVLVLADSFFLSAQEFDNTHTAITDELLSKITGVNRPQIINDCIVFTAPHTAHSVGIAFDFENFKKIHAFKLRTFTDIDGKPVDSWFFYILDIPKNAPSVSYRLIIDGLWTIDPLNPDSEYNLETGIRLSKVNIDRTSPPATETSKNNAVRFIYRGESGQKIRLGGSFTNWDSWIYTMNEIEPGLYALDLHLPEGTYYYSFYSGLKTIIDKTNPERAYTVDGRVASVLRVEYGAQSY
ncbi:glycogen-binding domain-containing protein [Treponema parvum]|uniref:glycogen-binding domain-containing protein n=1 Tax=Treponema parvum TaxID=138851 RepID=UPI002115F7E7|nr:glycogen-binding domain-containing protein [Treponema parvum]